MFQRPTVPEAPRQTGITSMNEDDTGVQKIEADAYISGSGGAQLEPALKAIVLQQLSNALNELSGTLRSRIYDSAGNVIREMPIRDLLAEMQDTNDVYGVVLDGVITQRLLELAIRKNIRAVYGIKANPLTRKHNDLIVYTKEQGTIN